MTEPATARLAPREPVTSLRLFGRGDRALVLSPAQRTFTIGAGGCDLVVPSALGARLEPLHATLERTASGLRIRDRESAHGVFRAVRGPRVDELLVEAGDVFWLADVPMLAMDTYLESLRSRIAWCVGLDRHLAIDEAVEASTDGPVALVGPPGTDARWLAEVVHRTSAQRAGAFLSAADGVLPALEAAAGSTVFLDLGTVAKLPAPYAKRLFDPTLDVHVIFAAADSRRLTMTLDSYSDRTRVVTLWPLRLRRNELLRLLAIHWRDELRTGRRIEELPRIEAITSYAWPRGFPELREHSVRLLAYLEHRGLRNAARALGIAHQTLSGHFRRIGFPCRDGDESAPSGLRPRRNA